MPVLVSFCHLLHDFHNVLVGRLHYSIHLRSIGRGPVMLDLEVLQVLLDPLGCEICTVIRDEGVWDPIPGDDVVSDKFLCHRGYDSLVGGSFHPLSEVVNHHKDEAMTIQSSGIYSVDDINPLSGEGPWQ